MSAIGYPDYQRITQWLGSPLVTHDALLIGLGPHVDGPLEVANFAAIVVALKATGGNVTVTVKQTVQGGPAAVVLSQSVVVAAGATLFEAFVLFGTAVEIDLVGSNAGTVVDYALYGSNTTTNAQVITSATINVQHNDVLVAAEATLDFVDAAGFAWSVVDDAPNTRVKITPPALALTQLFDVELAADAATLDVSSIPQTFNHLRVLMLLRETGAPTRDDSFIRWNNDAAAHYDWQLAELGPGATAPSDVGGVAANSARLGVIPGAGATAGRFAAIVLDMPLYTDANAAYARAKTWTIVNGVEAGGGLNTHNRVLSGTWDNAGVATAVNRMTLIPGTGLVKAGSRAIGWGFN